VRGKSDSGPAAARLAPVLQLVFLLGTSATVLAAYVANSPRLDRFGDSPTYEFVANALPRSFISSSRMPGYPVLIAVSSWLVPRTIAEYNPFSAIVAAMRYGVGGANVHLGIRGAARAIATDHGRRK
jgi:hypothetical protein